MRVSRGKHRMTETHDEKRRPPETLSHVDDENSYRTRRYAFIPKQCNEESLMNVTNTCLSSLATPDLIRLLYLRFLWLSSKTMDHPVLIIRERPFRRVSVINRFQNQASINASSDEFAYCLLRGETAIKRIIIISRGMRTRGIFSQSMTRKIYPITYGESVAKVPIPGSMFAATVILNYGGLKCKRI